MSDFDQLAYNLRKPLSVYLHSYADLDLGIGTDFPTTGHDGAALQAGARRFRSDLGWACYYDGTRWLTVHELTATVLPITNFAANGGSQIIGVRTDYQLFADHIAFWTRVNTTNNATNYWTVSMRAINTGVAAADTLYSFTTAADTAGIAAQRDVTPTTQVPTNRTLLDCQFAKGGAGGAPGTLDLTATLYYRLVIP